MISRGFSSSDLQVSWQFASITGAESDVVILPDISQIVNHNILCQPACRAVSLITGIVVDRQESANQERHNATDSTFEDGDKRPNVTRVAFFKKADGWKAPEKMLGRLRSQLQTRHTHDGHKMSSEVSIH